MHFDEYGQLQADADDIKRCPCLTPMRQRMCPYKGDRCRPPENGEDAYALRRSHVTERILMEKFLPPEPYRFCAKCWVSLVSLEGKEEKNLRRGCEEVRLCHGDDPGERFSVRSCAISSLRVLWEDQKANVTSDHEYFMLRYSGEPHIEWYDKEIGKTIALYPWRWMRARRVNWSNKEENA